MYQIMYQMYYVLCIMYYFMYQIDLNDTLSHTGENRSNLRITFKKVRRSQLIQLT